ncbi:methyltransferase [Streptomyces clavuligerus]|nr:methyltransferase [Streptomyces clavuligerus]ANW16813.1 SAM-dependent methyltransferase [Streptomyces clavuligerus]AXU11344.1 SAM-dependent methyltransferase [Streptomyces clavuligerus]MBY6301151.1 SAM-dependent methyltransferase [Streptomyces clavuligerus]QCS04212.1 SAM-dependent methyltransferase [Streptomyces clavuligerus]QPJ96401.1 SAM-dependent methyltransferase [Streptomyces clavuligerus]
MSYSDQCAEYELRAGRRSNARIVQEALGFLYPAALRAAAAVGVADHLTEGPRTAAELAGATGVHERNLYRVLRLLATRGLFTEDHQGRFGLTADGNALRTDSPVSARAAVLMLTDPTMWRPAGEMTRCLTEGTSAFDALFGQGFFEHFAQNEEIAAVFHAGMASLSDAENVPIAGRCSFRDGATVVDVGGGYGGLLSKVLAKGPTLRGILYDQAHVLAEHTLATPVPGGADPTGRWETAEGDFFASVPTGDVLILKRILHDWDDEQCVAILRNCREALAPGGRVMIIDALVPEGDAPHQSKDLDLMMMASLTGRERTEGDFLRLFGASGLLLDDITTTPTVLSVVEAVSADD